VQLALSARECQQHSGLRWCFQAVMRKAVTNRDGRVRCKPGGQLLVTRPHLLVPALPKRVPARITNLEKTRPPMALEGHPQVVRSDRQPKVL